MAKKLMKAQMGKTVSSGARKKTNTNGEDPRLKKAIQDSIKARKDYDFVYNYTLKNPNAKSQKEYMEYKDEVMSRPSKIRIENKELTNKRKGGTVKSKKKK